MPLPGTPIFKIGELRTIFYLCFLVYLLVFILESYMKNVKKYLLPFVFVCLLMLSLPWVWNHPNMEGWTCFTWIVFDQFVLALKTQPTWLREKSLDEHAHYTWHRLSEKGKHLWDQIQVSYCYAECLCHIYDFTCCSNIDHKHLPFQCEFNKNEILSSYVKGF